MNRAATQTPEQPEPGSPGSPPARPETPRELPTPLRRDREGYTSPGGNPQPEGVVIRNTLGRFKHPPEHFSRRFEPEGPVLDVPQHLSVAASVASVLGDA